MKYLSGYNFKFPFHNILIFIITCICSTVLSLFLFYIGTKSSPNIALVFILALILISYFTDGYIYGILFCIYSVFCINCCFTYPYFKLNFTLTGYPVTFIIMLSICLVTSATTSHIKIQNRLIAEREEMLNKAEKENMRANLLRAISHDLRTPLTSIIGQTDTYIESYLNDEEKMRIIKNINEDAHWLLNMVENLLSVTRIDDSKNTKVRKNTEIVEEVISESVSRLKKRHPQCEVTIKIPDDIILLPMDSLLIEQVIINLLENAVIHSESTVPVELIIEDNPREVIFHIRDYGKGISPEHANNIFDGTGTSKDFMSDGKKGMGIGLSICKTIIEAHNGKITATNHENGAEFIFRLPK